MKAPDWALDLVKHLPPLVPEEEAAAFFKVSTKTVKRWRNLKRLSAVRTDRNGSGRVLYARTELARLVAEMSD